jgi:hypothetical protein
LLISIVLLFLTTCNNFAPGGGGGDYDPDGVTYTDVAYSPDGKSVTIYLDEKVPITNRQNRALSKELAIAGHDYFEVVFHYKGASGDVISRASWELMKDAHVSGVFGKGKDDLPSGDPGIDYSAVSMLSLSDGDGAAILFVGKKTDKTLLALGRLSKVNGNPGYLINSSTTSVTFEVSALESGVIDRNNSEFADKSCFFTNFTNLGAPPQAASTAGTAFLIKEKQFPLFRLRENAVTRATYSFRTSSGGLTMEQYSYGIILAGPAAYEKKQPRYPVPGGGFQYYSLRLDKNTEITPFNYNNTTVGQRFTNPLEFQFDTQNGTVTGSVFALAFQVPVYPLSPYENPGTWYIRASYDSYWLDLDDGASGIGENGAGGAVLIGTGDPASYSDYKIVLVRPPTKWKYGPTGPPSNIPTGYEFLVTGMLVQMQHTDGTPIRYIAYEELLYYIGGWELTAGWAQQPPVPAPGDAPYTTTVPSRSPGSHLREELYGMQIIKVLYIDPYSGIEQDVRFPIMTNGGDPLREFTNIPPERTIYIRRNVYGTLQGALNVFVQGGTSGGFTFPGGSGTFLIVLGESINFDPIVQTEGNAGSMLVMMMAGVPGVTVGRESVNSEVFVDWARRNAYYFGLWPFNEPLQAHIFDDDTSYPSGTGVSGGWMGTPPNDRLMQTVSTTYPYTINAGGPYTSPTAVAPAGSDPADINVVWGSPGWGTGPVFFIRGGNGGRIYNVVVGDGVTVNNSGENYEGEPNWFH